MKAAKGKKQPDFIAMASASAGVSFKTKLTPEELVEALLSGTATPGKEAHFIVLLEESPSSMLKGLVQQAGARVTPEKVEKNLRKIAAQVGLNERTVFERLHRLDEEFEQMSGRLAKVFAGVRPAKGAALVDEGIKAARSKPSHRR
ncbi:MAG TPA: hypothetical protein VFC18_06330 [Burkholderiales bacterium]|nr:hypothetical protein [Burkholderiales bacterium]